MVNMKKIMTITNEEGETVEIVSPVTASNIWRTFMPKLTKQGAYARLNRVYKPQLSATALVNGVRYYPFDEVAEIHKAFELARAERNENVH
jgi:hypothetical protein